jgi:hypothetical protein
MTGAAAPKTLVTLESPELVIQTDPVASIAIPVGVERGVVSAKDVAR